MAHLGPSRECKVRSSRWPDWGQQYAGGSVWWNAQGKGVWLTSGSMEVVKDILGVRTASERYYTNFGLGLGWRTSEPPVKMGWLASGGRLAHQ